MIKVSPIFEGNSFIIIIIIIEHKLLFSRTIVNKFHFFHICRAWSTWKNTTQILSTIWTIVDRVHRDSRKEELIIRELILSIYKKHTSWWFSSIQLECVIVLFWSNKDDKSTIFMQKWLYFIWTIVYLNTNMIAF